MKLPSHLRKLRKFTVYSFSFYLLILVMFSPVPQIYAASSSLGNNPWFSNDSDLSNSRFETEIIVVDPAIKKDIRPEEVGFPYTSQTQSGDTSDQFSTSDYLSVNDYDELNLTNFSDTGKINNSYSISGISDYTNDSLSYNITGIESIEDYYTIEDGWDGFETLKVNGYYSLAQEFEVKWDYAMFYDTQLYLSYDTPSFNSLDLYELDLFLVNASSVDGKPDMSKIIASCTGNSFIEGTTYNDIGFQSFDFPDVKLVVGSYFIVANLSVIDSDDALRHFIWLRNNDASDGGIDDGDTYFRHDGIPGVWSGTQTYDFTMINNLLPCDSDNSSTTFTSPDQINLYDNSDSITSNTASISSVGFHELVANTSVQITFNNSYTFAKTFSGNDVYSAFNAANSSYWSYNIDWDINWTTPIIDISPYSNLDRYQVVYTPADWHDTIFTFYYNETNTLTSSRETTGYRVDLGANNSAGNWLLSTTSPNYLSDLELLDDTIPTERFLLGYWVGGATDSTGYVGSKIVANTLVQGDGAGTPYNETTGSLNYTLYDINGNIIPLKSSLPANLIYTDTTSYSLSGITQVSAGFYTPEIYFDPSASGSDLPGFWTAAVLWQNGTEVGFYSQRIVVQTQTELVLEWEEEPSNDNWITTDISRIGLDSILVRGSYYNISEPYTTGTKNIIPTATVSYTVYNATWNKNDVFNDYAPDYNTSILVDANIDVGTYTVDFLGTGAFLENNSTSFTLTVFYELSLIPEYTNYQTNYTNNVLYYLNLYDVTASSNLSLTPNDMNVTITNGTDFPLSTPVDYNFTHQASPEQWILNISTSTNDLYTGDYSVEISIYLNNYQANYSEVFVSDVYTFQITAPKTSIQKIGDPTTIYVYHDVTFSFRFLDTNHSTALLGANFAASANVSNIDFSYNIIGDTYYVTVTNNNPAVNSIAIYVDISLSNYESKIGFLLGELSVLTIQTSLTEVSTPTEVYVGYITSIIVQFNDITHAELIDVGTGTFVTITSNSSSFDDTLGYVYIGSGEYNVSFINNDFTLEGINITITIGKTGYENASISFQIQVISIPTDSRLVDSADQDITIYFDEGTSIEIIYWDNISFVNITDPQALFSGNLTVIPSYSFLDNITTITILTILDLGYYELIITLVAPGYEPQIITVYILVQERQTSIDSDYTDITFYADQTDHVLLNYTDEVDLVVILAATVDIDFAVDNSSLIIQDYFNVTWVEVGSFYEITFDPIEINSTGYVFLFNITLSKYGYETIFIVITVTITIHPTAIDPSSQDQDSVYTDEDGEFTIIYETIEDTFISGAELSYSLINGTSADIEDVVLTQILDAYVIYVYINSSIVPVKSFLIELTFYKHGFENQTWIITITITIHPTAIDPSSQDQDSVYTDEDGEFTIIYETIEDTFISGADLSYTLINGTSAEIEDVVLTQILDAYVVYVYINSSIVPVKSYLIELTFYKHGFENQTWIITITIILHPTAIDPTSQDQDSVYSDEDGEFTIIYETIEDTFISGAELSYTLINGTSAEIENVVLTQILDAYVVYVYINSSIVPVKSYLIELTFYKHGFENQTWIITITIILHPTAIDPTSQDEDTINNEEDGEFTVIYETIEDTFISGADLSYTLINGTSAEIEDVVLTQILDAYVVYVYINSSIVPVKSYLIELTFYKHGFENQTWIITITVASHPTAIDPTSQDEDNIYADENAEFTIIYETEEGDFISGAEFDYNIINGTTAEILSVTYTQSIDSYLIYVYFDESLIAGKNFSIELIFFKHGFDNQSWIINIGVYEKITHEISVEIVGDMRQLTTIQFRVTLNSSDLDLLTALSFDNIKFFSTPDGDFVVITYVFTFANGTTIEYSIQAELQQIQPGHYVALTSEILVPWRVTNVSYSALYTPTSQSVIASEETISQSTEIKSAKFTNLIAYLFSEYTPYMAASLAVIAAVFISLTIYFAIVRPRKQRRTAKKRGYLDKISKILTSVISMRKVIIVHTETGLPIYEWDLGGDISVDSSLVTGFLQAVSGMGSEISGGQTGAIKKLDYGQFVVSSASKDCICAYLFSTSEVSIDVETGLSNFVEWFEKRFQSVLHEWSGVTDEFTTNSRQIIDTLSEELFIWTLHPLSVNTLKEKDVHKLNSFGQKIYNFIKDYKEVTISVALEYFNKTPLEETLSTLFNMIDEKYLLRMRLR